MTWDPLVRCTWITPDPDICYEGSKHLKESVLVRMVADQVSRGRGSKGRFYYSAMIEQVAMSATRDWAVMLPEREQFL